MTRVVVGFAARRLTVVEARSVAPDPQVDIAVPVSIAMTVARQPRGPTDGGPFRMFGPAGSRSASLSVSLDHCTRE